MRHLTTNAKAIGAQRQLTGASPYDQNQEGRQASTAVPIHAMKCSKHTKAPSGYMEWYYWAERKSKTHKQIKCPDCGLFKIWIKI